MVEPSGDRKQPGSQSWRSLPDHTDSGWVQVRPPSWLKVWNRVNTGGDTMPDLLSKKRPSSWNMAT